MRKNAERLKIEDKYPFLSDLNNEQFEGATYIDGSLLILAGAGSGKTKTIISRTAYLIAREKCEPSEILIMTFTNKAAKEMKERGEKILKDNNYWKGTMPSFTTFHSWGAKFMRSSLVREEALYKIGLNKRFDIIDSTDQKTIFNKLKHKVFPKDIADDIKNFDLLLPMSSIQNHLIPYDDFRLAESEIANGIEEGYIDFSKCISRDFTPSIIQMITELYIEYKKELRKNNLVDFDDLINLPIKIIQEDLDLREYFSNKYKYLMVDEFQDTNNSQLALMKLFINDNQNICVVGDDAQSIYGWRGAEIKYILNFHKMFKNTKMINLKINYRSHHKIVTQANKLLTMSEEKHEFKEELEAYSQLPGIVKARFFHTPQKEANFMAKTMKILNEQKDIRYGEMAVLYRAAVLNRKVEIELIREHIPYKIHRGKTLLEKKISLDILSYLKYLNNEKNEISLSKLLISAKILSEKRLAEFNNQAEAMGESLYEYMNSEGYVNVPRLSKNIKEKIVYFMEEVADFSYKKDNLSYQDFLKDFFDNNSIVGLNEEIMDSNLGIKGTNAEKKLGEATNNLNIIEIIKELASGFKSLSEFLEVIALDGEQVEKEEDKVNLMTIHASKGLEFDVVFVMGMTSKIFPSSKPGSSIEEERRLAYVAMTRARKYLSLSGAVGYYGPDKDARPSLFIREAGVKVQMEE